MTGTLAALEARSKTLPVVGVLGSGTDSHDERCAVLGSWLAAQHVHLLTGGGQGVMQSVSRAFATVADRSGLVIGVIPGGFSEAAAQYRVPNGYPNAWVELPIHTHLPDSGKKGTAASSRNHINVLSSDVIVVLPGEFGTASEAALAVRYNKPVIAWLNDRSQVSGLHPSVPVVRDFAKVQRFISSNL